MEKWRALGDFAEPEPLCPRRGVPMPETAIVTTQPGKKAKKQLHGIGFPSERRKFELAEVLDDLYPDNVSDSDGEGSNIKPGGRGRVMVKSAYGKVRPLDKTGRFADRAAPAGPPPLHRDHLETKKKAMPFSYHSHKAQVTDPDSQTA